MGSKKAVALDTQLCDRRFRSDDERFGLEIRTKELRKLLQHCLDAGGLETGGIVVGNYSQSHEIALIWDVSGPPCDSKSGATWFHRGVQGLQAWLHRLWSKNRYYLGEWHFHPGGRPIPSDTDLRQIREISDLADYRCPEPVLIIIGGSPSGSWELAVYVSPRNCCLMELREIKGALIAQEGCQQKAGR